MGQLAASWGTVASWASLLVVSGAFWYMLRVFTSWSPALFISLSMASFVTGALAGFIFTSYGEEAATVGKIRDWMLGGFAGLSIAEFKHFTGLLQTFAGNAGPEAYALTVAVAVVFAGLGFFAMFFQRELILNVLLAESRDRRGRVDGTKLAGVIKSELVAFLPPSVLSGIEDIDEDISDSQKPEAQRLKQVMGSDEVTKFLLQCDAVAASGAALDWDVVSTAAVLHYYLTYLLPADKRDAERSKALEWLRRALLVNPGHADLTAKYADVLAQTGATADAVTVLERLDQTLEAPAYIRNWISYYLLRLGTRNDDALRYSEDFLSRYPSDPDALFNSARAYARRFVELVRTSDAREQEMLLRATILNRLRRALDATPEKDREAAKVWVKSVEDFAFLKGDPDFDLLVGTS